MKIQKETKHLLRTAGFTLVEMVCSLVIISILICLCIPTCLGYVDDVRMQQCVLQRAEICKSYLSSLVLEPPTYNNRVEVISALNEYIQKIKLEQNVYYDGDICTGDITVTDKGNCYEVHCSEHGSGYLYSDWSFSTEYKKDATGGTPITPSKPDLTDPDVKPTTKPDEEKPGVITPLPDTSGDVVLENEGLARAGAYQIYYSVKNYLSTKVGKTPTEAVIDAFGVLTYDDIGHTKVLKYTDVEVQAFLHFIYITPELNTVDSLGRQLVKVIVAENKPDVYECSVPFSLSIGIDGSIMYVSVGYKSNPVNTTVIFDGSNYV